MGVYNRIKTWISGEVLTAANLNSEFNAVQTAVNNVEAAQIAANAVGTSKIADDAVTSAKIADSTIVSANIADDAIITSKIADDAITTPLIADDAITTALIADNTIRAQNVQRYDSGDFTIGTGATATKAHGLTDQAGAARAPFMLSIIRLVSGQYRYNDGNSYKFTYDATNVVVENTSGSSLTVRITAF